MRNVLLFTVIIISALVLIGACGGGGKGPVIIPPPNNNTNNDNNNPPADDNLDSIVISGAISYSGLLQSSEGSQRTSSASPISNAGIALLNNQAAMGASVTNDTGWFELEVEDVPSNADLRLKIELKTTDTDQSRLFVSLPLILNESRNGSVNLTLSGYDDNNDGLPDGLRLQGGMNGGSFKQGVLDSLGLDMPFGVDGPYHGWLGDKGEFFEGTAGFGNGWSDDFNLEGNNSPLPDGTNPPADGNDSDNRIEVNGKVVEIDSVTKTYSAEGVRIIFIAGLVFEEHGTFPVQVSEETKYQGIGSFEDIVLGMDLKAAGKRLVDNVLKAKRVRSKPDRPSGEGYFAADGTILDVKFDPREIWPPLGANVHIEGVLITFLPNNGMPNFEFGEFVISVDNLTILAGIEHLGELQPRMRSTFFGPYNSEQLLASLLITSPKPPIKPPPPPPFGVTFHGQVVDLKPDQQLVGVLGYWADIIDGENFGNRPPWTDPDNPSGGNKIPMQTDNWGRPDDLGNEGEGYGGNTPPGWPDDPILGRPEPVLVWIKIVRETKLAGIGQFSDIVIGDNAWSEMQIGPDGSIKKDENGNPIAMYFEVQRTEPPRPGIFGIVTDVKIFEDPAGNSGQNGIVTIAPYGPMPMNRPDDPTLPPPDGTINEVEVRVIPETILEGLVNLNEIVIGDEGHAFFFVDQNGLPKLDDAGRPIAEFFGVFIPPPPPPPPSSVYGHVLEVKVFKDKPQNNGTVKLESFCYGWGGPNGGWRDPSNPDGGGTDPGIYPPDDPSKPPIWENIVIIRVDENTKLEGVESLSEMALITDPMDAEAIFRLNSDGKPTLDEMGNPIANILFVYPVQSPPPPDDFITMEGSVMEYEADKFITIAPVYNDGEAGIMEFRFEISDRTKIDSVDGIQLGDQVFIEGMQVLDPNGTARFVASYILEFRNYIP